MIYGHYSVSKAAPIQRQPCNCDITVAKYGRQFPHKRGRECPQLLDERTAWRRAMDAPYRVERERDAIDDSRAADAREHNARVSR